MDSGEGEQSAGAAVLVAENAQLRARLAALIGERDEYKRLAELLKRELERLRDLQKTPREHVSPAQVQLAFAEMAAQLLGQAGAAAAPDAGSSAASTDKEAPKPKRKRTPHGRAILPEHLPVETLVVSPASVPEDAVVLGEEVSWRLGFRRASFYRLKLVRPIYVVGKDAITDGDHSSARVEQGDVSVLSSAEPAAPSGVGAGAGDAASVSPETVGELATRMPAADNACAAAAPLARTAARATAQDAVRDGDPANGSLALTTILCAAAPDEIIPRGLPTPDLLAHIFTGKFADKLPFNRQEGIFAREGARITRGTMCGWAEHAHGLARFVVDAMCQEARSQAHYIATDSTGVLVQANEKCKKGHFWVFVADQEHVFFRYSARHSSDQPKTFLQGFRGTVLADASSVYDAIFRLPDGPEEAGCNAHARRYLYKALPSDRERALVGIGFYNRLFELERAFPKNDPPRRLQLRQEQSAPVVALLDQWRRAQLAHPDVADGTPIRKALNYIGNHWAALTRFLGDGRIPIHNNRSELELRRLVVGRANWLFVGSDETAAWTCTFVSLIASCQLLGLDPEAYLRDLLRVLPVWPRSRALELAPKYWHATRARLNPDELALPLGPITVPPKLPPTGSEQPAEKTDADETGRAPLPHEA